MNQSPFSFRLTSLLLVIALFAAALGLAQPAGAASDPGLKWEQKVDPWVMETASQGQTEFLVFLAEQADLSAAAALPTRLEKGTYVYQTLSALAQRTQEPVLAQLKQLGVEHRAYWATNVIWVRGGLGTVQAMAQRGDVARIYANPWVRLDEPALAAATPNETFSIEAVNAILWNISLVNANDVWDAGYRGQGVVIGGQDTGYQWNHNALYKQYRGWDGVSANHNYNWHDAIHSGTSDCGIDLTAPCDDHGHGTHTMGTMVGEYEKDGTIYRIGMAPEAKWIGCRNMVEGWGSPTSYLECYEWFIAPTNLQGTVPRPDLAPDVINNSWSCTVEEGCVTPDILLEVVQNVRAAGILTVHSAGNTGSACSTISAPAAIYDESYTVGNTTSEDKIASNSSRGPVTVDGSNRMKPDISAPGTSIYSSYPDNTYATLSGTSMAAPHVAGLAALLISAYPELAGNVNTIEAMINASAAPVIVDPVQICNLIPSTTIPNNTFGWGRIDALEAYRPRLSIAKSTPDQNVPIGSLITYEIKVKNTHLVGETTNVLVSDTLPEGTYFFSASDPFTIDGSTITWNLGTLQPGEEKSLALVVRVGFEAQGTVTNAAYSARSDQAVQVFGSPVSTVIEQIPLYYVFLPTALK